MDRSDVFLSYRRADVEFAQKLYNKLKETDRGIWVDWENLPPGVEGFSDEIQRGIQGSDAFVCILSPSYLESEYCLQELREALKLKKRVIPIVLKKFEPMPPPEGIGHINWVYFTPHAGQKNTFTESFPKVIQALDADYEHVREHTRLLLRAIDWQKNEKNTSYLLKGDEIGKAERWQLAAIGKNPAPTELQGEYILASRAYQRGYQRRLTAILGMLMVIAVFAAIFAFIKRNEAVVSQQTAISQRNTAQAEEARANAASTAAVAAKNEAEAAQQKEEIAKQEAQNQAQNALISGLAAQSQLVQQHQLGILLALEAYNESGKKGETNPAVETALRSTLVDFSGLPVHSYPSEGTFVQFSPDDRWLISAGHGIAKVSDLSQSLETEPISLGSGDLSNITVSPDSQWLAGTSSNSESGRAEIHLWALGDLQAGPQVLNLPEQLADPSILTLSFGGNSDDEYWLVAGLRDGSVYRWSAAGLPQSQASFLYKDPSGRSVTAMAFSPDGTWLAVAFSSANRSRSSVAPILRLWTLQTTGNEPLSLNLQLVTMNRLVFSKSGRWLAGSGIHQEQQVKFRLWDMLGITTGTFANTADVEDVNDIAFSPDDRWVAVVGAARTQVWKLPNFTYFDLPGYRDIVLTARFDADSRLLATGDYNGQIQIWNTAEFSTPALIDVPERVYSSFDVKVNSLNFNSAGDRLAAAGDHQVRIWNFPETVSAPIRLPLYRENYRVLGNNLLAQTSANELLATDLSEDEPRKLFQASLENPISYDYSPDQRYLVIRTERQFELWDLQNGDKPLFGPETIQSGTLRYSLFTSDSRWFVYAVYDKIYAIDLHKPDAITELSGNRRGSDISGLTTLEQWLISASRNEILAWDTSSAWGEPVSLTKATGLQLPEQNSTSWVVVKAPDSLSVWSAADFSSEPISIPDELFRETIDDRWLVSSTSDPDSQTHLWDLTEPDAPIAEFQNFEDYGYSPSENWFYYYDDEETLHVLDLSSPDVQPVALEAAAYDYPVFSPDDQWMAVSSKAGDSVLLYQLTSGLKQTEVLGIVPSAFSMDGRWLVGDPTEDNLTNALLIDLQNPDNRYLLTGHTDEIVEKIFMPDQRSLLTYGYDGTIRIWSLENPSSDPVVLPHKSEIWNVSLSENGQWLISQTSDAVYIWQWDINDVHDLACRLVGRNLTTGEWRKYAGDADYEKTCSQWR